MVRGKAFGHAAERVRVDGLHGCARGARLQEFVELRAVVAMMLGHPAAKGEELIALRHEGSCRDGDVFAGEIEVEAAA